MATFGKLRIGARGYRIGHHIGVKPGLEPSAGIGVHTQYGGPDYMFRVVAERDATWVARTSVSSASPSETRYSRLSLARTYKPVKIDEGGYRKYTLRRTGGKTFSLLVPNLGIGGPPLITDGVGYSALRL